MTNFQQAGEIYNIYRIRAVCKSVFTSLIKDDLIKVRLVFPRINGPADYEMILAHF